MNDKSLKATIPKLKSPTNYKKWKKAILSYLRTKYLSIYLEYEVHDPVKLLTLEDALSRTQTDETDNTDQRPNQNGNTGNTNQNQTGNTDNTNQPGNRAAQPENPDARNAEAAEEADADADVDADEDPGEEIAVTNMVSILSRRQTDLPLLLTRYDQEVESISIRIPEQVQQQIEQHDIEDIRIYTQLSPDRPKHMLKFIHKSAITIVAGSHLWFFYDNQPSYMEACENAYTDRSKVETALRAAVLDDDLFTLDDAMETSTLYHGFQLICEDYEKDLVIERDSILSKMEQLRCKAVTQYIKEFKSLLVEYKNVGGSLGNSAVRRAFLRNLPSHYRTYKNLMPNDYSLRQMFKFFKDIYDKDRSSMHRIDAAPVRKVPAATISHKSDSKIYVKPKCTLCGGKGHSKENCGNAGPVCYECGHEHLLKDCPVYKKKRRAAAVIVNCISLEEAQAVLTETADTPSDPREEPTHSSPKPSTSTTSKDNEVEVDEEDSVDYYFNAVFVAEAYTQQTCNCRFQGKCIQALLDSGSSRHITGQQELLSNQHAVNPVNIVNAFGKASKSRLAGDLKIMLRNNVSITLHDVLDCSAIQGTLISTSQMLKQGFQIEMRDESYSLKKHDKEFYRDSVNNGIYVLHATVDFTQKQSITVSAAQTDPYMAHLRYGHASEATLKLNGLISQGYGYCGICGKSKLKAKAHHKLLSDQTEMIVPKAPLESVSMDTTGHFPHSYKGLRYFVLIVDRFSRFLWALLVKTKGQIPQKVMEWQKQITTETNLSVKQVLADQGSEFNNNKLRSFWKSVGTLHRTSSAYHPRENGLIERSIQLVKQTAKVMLKGSQLGNHLWPYSVQYAVRIWNSLRRKNRDSPYEVFYNKARDMSRFFIFGAQGFFKQRTSNSFTKENIPGYFLGYTLLSPEVLFLDMNTHRVRTARDLTLNEQASMDYQRTALPVLEDEADFVPTTEPSPPTSPTLILDLSDTSDDESEGGYKPHQPQPHCNG